ncbi:TIGR01777 family protein [Cytobacillus suaedae]|nr:TIGR01777 family protein [Cytobacillus suaedae]
MNIAIAGGTGFVGTALTNYLISKGHNVFILTRNVNNKKEQHPNLHYVKWLSPDSTPEAELTSIDAIVNLAGESINSGRWTTDRKKRILASRINATEKVIDLISSLSKKPEVLVNASAIGIYGTSLDETFTERSKRVGSDFLATTVHTWEKEALKSEEHGVRTVLARFGIILGEREGALPRMVLPYKLFIGGTIASGHQWLSWVHIQDVVRMIEFAITHESIKGPLNITTPEPKQMKDFGITIGAVIGRPHWLPVPSFALRLLLGEMSTLVVDGQKVLPEKIQQYGYRFLYENLEEALENILKT